MPELPEVETVKRGLAPVMEGATITRLVLNRDNLRFPFPEKMAERLEGRKILGLSRRAKYVLVELDGDETLLMHLGMSGSFRIETALENGIPGSFHHDRSKNPAHDHVVFHLQNANGTADIIYNDPRRFGFMDLATTSKLAANRYFTHLGIEPTGNMLNGEILGELFAGKNTSLKAALLDQSLIAGLGNIYVCEALWRAGLSPKRKAGTICTKGKAAKEKRQLLADSIRDVIAEAIEAGGSSLRDHRQADGKLGYFQHTFAVYDREGAPCPTREANKNHPNECGGTIARITQSGRSSFYCPKCQR